MAYKSLGQKIIDLSSLAKRPSERQKVKLREQRARLTEKFPRPAELTDLEYTTWHHMFSYGHTISNDLLATAYFKDKIPNAMRLRPTRDVIYAVQKMRKSTQSDLLRAFEFARAPFPLTWIEFPIDNTPYRTGLLIEEVMNGDRLDALNIRMMTGALDYQTVPHSYNMRTFNVSAKGIERSIFYSQGSALSALLLKIGAFIDRTGTIVARNRSEKPVEQNRYDEIMLTLSFLLLLNSRSQILRVGAEHGNPKAKKGKLSFKPVEFDIARILEKRGLSADQAQALQIEALVRGHFKLRQTGVFWWSPFIRNPREDVPETQRWAEQLGRDRNIGLSQSQVPVVLPTGDHTLG